MVQTAKFLIVAKDEASKVFTGVSKNFKKMGTASKKFGDSFSKNMNRATDAIEKNRKGLEKIRNRSGVAFGVMSTGLALITSQAATAAGAYDKFGTVFKEGTDDMLLFVKELRKIAPEAESDLVRMTANIQDLIVPMGVARDEAQELTKGFATVANEISAFNDVPMAQVMGDIQSAIAGSTETLTKYGINAKVGALEAKALSLGLLKQGESFATLDSAVVDQIKIQSLYAKIVENSSDAISGFEKNNDSADRRIQNFRATMNEFSLGIGNVFIPVLDSIVIILTPIIDKFTEWSEKYPDLTRDVGLLTIGLTGLLFVTTSYLLILPKLRTAMLAVGAATKLMMGPIPLLIGATILLAVVIFRNWDKIKSFIVNTVETIRAFLSNSWESIKAKITAVWTSIKDFFSNIWGSISNNTTESWTKLKDFFANIWEGIKGIFEFYTKSITVVFDAFKALFKGDFEGFWNGIKEFFTHVLGGLVNFYKTVFSKLFEIGKVMGGKIRDGIVKMRNSITSFFSDAGTKMLDSGSNMMDMFVQGIMGKIQAVRDAASKVVNEIKKFLGFASPTEEGPGSNADQWMPNLVNMLAEGLNKGANTIKTSATKLAENIQVGLGEFIESNVEEQFQDKVSSITSSIGEFADELPESEQKFKDFREGIIDQMKQLDEQYADITRDISERTKGLNEEISNLKIEFEAGEAGDVAGLAEAYVQQQDKVNSIFDELAEKQGQLDTATSDSTRDRLAGDLAELNEKLAMERAALEENSFIARDFANEVAEARRLSELTAFERFVEKTQRRMTARKKEFDDNIMKINQEKIALIQQQVEARIEYESSRKAIEQTLTTATAFYISQIQSQEIATKDSTQLMTTYYDNVTKSIERMIAAQKEAGYSNGGIAGQAPLPTQTFSNGGLVQGPGGVDKVPAMVTAGELILNKAQQNNVAAGLNSGGGQQLSIVVTGNSFFGDDEEFAEKIGNQIIKDLSGNTIFQSY